MPHAGDDTSGRSGSAGPLTCVAVHAADATDRACPVCFPDPITARRAALGVDVAWGMSCHSVAMMKYILRAACASLLLLRTASAQIPTPAGIAPPTPTTFERVDQPLSGLLNNGWTVNGFSGPEGNIFLLSKGSSVVRCQLFGSANSGTPLSIQDSVGSICHKLN